MNVIVAAFFYLLGAILAFVQLIKLGSETRFRLENSKIALVATVLLANHAVGLRVVLASSHL